MNTRLIKRLTRGALPAMLLFHFILMGPPGCGETDADVDGWTVQEGDCNDNNANVHPEAAELCDGLDNDCLASVPLDEADADGDGYKGCQGDCDDSNPAAYPGAFDQPGSGVDEYCDGQEEGAFIRQIDGGMFDTLALDIDGRVWAWGMNYAVADMASENLYQVTPTLVPGLPANIPAVAIASGAAHSLVLLEDGSVMSWGDNSGGQLGDGTSLPGRATPAHVIGLPSDNPVVAIAAGYIHSLVLLEDGTLMAWGSSVYLGNTTVFNTPVPVSGLPAANPIIDMEGGYTFTLALLADGSVLSWNGFTGLPTPVEGLPVGVPVVDIAAGYGYSLAALQDGSVMAWGDNSSGQLGDGTTFASSTPVAVIDLPVGNPVVAVTAAYNHSLALLEDGSALGWGRNALGAVGDGTITDHSSPVAVAGLPAGTSATSVAAAHGHSLAMLEDGSVKSWGNNLFGQLGIGSVLNSAVPMLVSNLPADNLAAAVAAGAGHSLALLEDGTMMAWGHNDLGQLGDGTMTSRSRPVPVSGLPAISPVLLVAAGSNHSMVRLEDGTVLAWGHNGSGQLGDGTTENRYLPVPVAGLPDGNPPSSLDGGYGFSVALLEDGSVMTWGANDAGQLGTSAAGSFSTIPVPVLGLPIGNPVLAIAAGGAHCLALLQDGSIWSWGSNYSGELGNSTDSQRSTPMPVVGLPGGNPAIAVAAGSSHSLALLADGSVMAWGGNWAGQLGDDTSTAQYTPVSIVGLPSVSPVVDLAAGGYFSLAMLENGSLFAWGENDWGQLGIDSTANSSTPVLVTPDILELSGGAAAVFGGGDHTLAITAGGQVASWGAYNYGQLGIGDTWSPQDVVWAP